MFLHPRALVFKSDSLRQISLAMNGAFFFAPDLYSEFGIENVQHRAASKKFCQ